MSMNKNCEVEVSVLIFAMRYAMGRQTCSPSIVVDNIKHNISKINNIQVEFMIRSIERHGEYFSFGMECDEALWLGFKDYLKDVLSERLLK